MFLYPVHKKDTSKTLSGDIYFYHNYASYYKDRLQKKYVGKSCNGCSSILVYCNGESSIHV